LYLNNKYLFQIRPIIEKVYPANDLKEAFEKLSHGSARGKLVLEF
jgi:NADPH:quinone reductase-like Zn-dependent oxidoreductase